MSVKLLVLLTAVGAASMQAQSAADRPSAAEASAASEQTEEIVVRGRRLSELRYELQAAREHAYGVFNALNSNDEFDIHCRDQRN